MSTEATATTAAAASLEEIIQRKLLSNKYDKILTKMCSNYIKLTLSADTDSEEYHNRVREVLEDIQQLEYQTFKYGTALRSIAKDSQSVQDELKKTKSKIEQTNTQIVEMKEQLKQEEVIKKNKEEYNVLASEVKLYDPKTNMLKKIEQVEQEIQLLNQTHEQELANIAKQENYLRTLLSSLSSLINSNATG